MSPRACRATIDFVRLSHEHGSTLYSDDFIQSGCESLPKTIRERYPGLRDWHGPSRLADRLQSLASAKADWRVLLAARSANVMKFAARVQFGQCRKVLITDLTWPSYEAILCRQQKRSGNEIHKVAVLESLLQDKCSMDEVFERLATQYAEHKCDGLFLPLVDNRGIHLPIWKLVDRIRRNAEIRFCVVDAAQALHHVPLNLHEEYCDFVVAGCHKWLCAHAPMGLGFYGRKRSREFIGESLDRWLQDGSMDDPLLSYFRELTTGESQPFGETVPVLPMLTANGAAIDADEQTHERFQSQNRRSIVELIQDSEWELVLPARDFQSQILLARPKGNAPSRSANCVRQAFLVRGIALTAYEDGTVRVAIPKHVLSSKALDHMCDTFKQIC